MAANRTIHHYGPDPVYVGGMGSVIRVLTEHQMGGGPVVSHSTWRPNSRLASLPLALRAALTIPRSHATDIIHVHLAEDGAFLREGAIVVLARLRGKTTVVTIHAPDFLSFAREHGWLASYVLKRAHLITCLDRDTHRLTRQMAPRARVELLPNPVVVDRDSPGADETGELVLFAGEIGLRKGADVLCEAWRLVAKARPAARCVMVGPIHDFVAPTVERLEVRPPIDAAAMKRLLRSARVVALPSRAEGMPMVLTEAMGAGRPFVSTPVGAISDLACQGGVLVGVENHVELATSLIALLADPELAQRIGEKGRQFCLETRSVAVVDAQLRQLYEVAADG